MKQGSKVVQCPYTHNIISTIDGGNVRSVNCMDERQYNSQQKQKSMDLGEPGMGIAWQAASMGTIESQGKHRYCGGGLEFTTLVGDCKEEVTGAS